MVQHIMTDVRNHMCFTLKNVREGTLTKIKPKTVLLADKSKVIAQQIREVMLPFKNSKIRLRSVLLIPGLGYNLISVV